MQKVASTSVTQNQAHRPKPPNLKHPPPAPAKMHTNSSSPKKPYKLPNNYKAHTVAAPNFSQRWSSQQTNWTNAQNHSQPRNASFFQNRTQGIFSLRGGVIEAARVLRKQLSICLSRLFCWRRISRRVEAPTSGCITLFC